MTQTSASALVLTLLALTAPLPGLAQTLPARAASSTLSDVRWAGADPTTTKMAGARSLARQRFDAPPTVGSRHRLGRLPLVLGVGALVAGASILAIRSHSGSGVARPTGVSPIPTTVTIGGISIGGPR